MSGEINGAREAIVSPRHNEPIGSERDGASISSRRNEVVIASRGDRGAAFVFFAIAMPESRRSPANASERAIGAAKVVALETP